MTKQQSYSRKWYLANKEKLASKRIANKKEINAKQRLFYSKNREMLLTEKRELSHLYKERKAAYDKSYETRKRNTDPLFKLKKNLRNRLYDALRGNFKTGSAVRDLGCSIPEFKNFIEAKFQPEMTWDNYGDWHLDHVKPLASFDITQRGEFLKAFHFSNYQPLWAIDNLRKADKILN